MKPVNDDKETFLYGLKGEARNTLHELLLQAEARFEFYKVPETQTAQTTKSLIFPLVRRIFDISFTRINNKIPTYKITGNDIVDYLESVSYARYTLSSYIKFLPPSTLDSEFIRMCAYDYIEMKKQQTLEYKKANLYY